MWFLCIDRLISFLNGHYTVTKSLSGDVWNAGKYATKASENAFTSEDCAAYCYLDNVTPCRAFAVVESTCYLLDFSVGTSAIAAGTADVKWNTGL